jgi:ribonucleoside-diphosphate reductase alpha chain
MGVNSINDAIKLAHSRINHKVKSVEFLTEIEDVYDLTVDVTHNFAIITKKDDNAINSSGVFVHNCHEISLNPTQFCNLTTINQTGITSEKDFLNRVYAASLIGTLQASYTDFSYLRPQWRETTEREALLGVSFTGIADSRNMVNAELLRKGASLVLEVNEKYAKKIGINPAARTTAIKPEGTSSCVLGSSSGIHARHSGFYIRRIRMNKDDALAVYLKSVIPELVEDDITSATGVVVSIPQESPEGAIVRENETAINLLNRSLFYSRNWVNPGHREGDNKHNVSVTISVKDNEWTDLRETMWKNRDLYSGISLLPYSDSNYKQMPFEECSQDKYNEMSKSVKEIDLKQVKEVTDNTVRIEQMACSGGLCEIT